MARRLLKSGCSETDDANILGNTLVTLCKASVQVGRRLNLAAMSVSDEAIWDRGPRHPHSGTAATAAA